ncbi:MAG TPA: AAA family ATPase [Candidatus Deferrimicrobiaceae bacterium]|jgi:hypothetical protein
MITGFSVSNFKAIKKTAEINIKPITIICGKNSSGKSSLIQSLLLLKQTLDAPRINAVEMSLEGEYLHYAHLSDIAHGLPQPNSAKIEYRFFVQPDKMPSGYFGIVFRQSGRVKKSKKGPYVSEMYWGNKDIGHKQIKLENDKLKIGSKVFLDLINEDKSSTYKLPAELTLFRFLPEAILVETDKGKNRFVGVETSKAIMVYAKELFHFINQIRYLSPLRAVPQRAYLQFSSQDEDIAIDGSNSAMYLWHNKDKKVAFAGESKPLLVAVNECLKAIGLDQEISVKRTNRILYQLTARLPGSSKKMVPISDVGFGYSQILPMIIRGLSVRGDILTIYEQPEIHLHPSSAGKIADVLFIFAKDGRRSIVETHSADLINKLRLRIVENNELSKLVNVVFIEPDSTGDVNIRQFEFNEDGMPPDWPDGFLDESQKIAEQIILARLNK